MLAGERFKGWVTNFANEKKASVADWFHAWMFATLSALIRLLFPALTAHVKEGLIEIVDYPGTPPYLRALLESSLELSEKGQNLQAWGLTLLGSVLAIAGAGKPAGRIYEYMQDKLTQSARLDPSMVITAWRRDKAANAKWFDDLADQGWSADRILALKEITEVIPNAADIVRFALREVYSPEIAKAYGQFLDIPEAAYPDAARAGLTKDMFDKYWAAHWGLPSASDGFELLHRGILTEDELKDLLKANDIMPYWRDQLIKLSWNIPTRVDVRRFWDMRTIDEKRLREIYTGLGYHAQDLEDYVLWTKIFVDFPDLLARYKNGWITLDQVKAELIAMGMKPARADTMIEEKVKKAAPERVAKERDLTAAEIIKGIKKGLITDVEGAELLQDMGYNAEEAWFKIAIEMAAAAGSPDTFAEFKDLTQKWRLASGMEGKPMTEEIKGLGREVVRLTAEVAAIERSIKAEQGTMVSTEGLPETATAHLRELQSALYKAQAELQRVRTDYNAKIAEWKHASK